MQRRPAPSAEPDPFSGPAKPSPWLYLRRALRLRCPECGVSPMFVPLRRTRGIDDWLRPLDGCPRCGYAYEREPGYFLLATWGMQYFTVGGVGLIVALLVDYFFKPPLWVWVASAAIPTFILGLLFVRHAKAIYLAIDHWFDPHVKDRNPSGRRRTKP